MFSITTRRCSCRKPRFSATTGSSLPRSRLAVTDASRLLEAKRPFTNPASLKRSISQDKPLSQTVIPEFLMSATPEAAYVRPFIRSASISAAGATGWFSASSPNRSIRSAVPLATSDHLHSVSLASQTFHASNRMRCEKRLQTLQKILGRLCLP
jgi:hypothetical protein